MSATDFSPECDSAHQILVDALASGVSIGDLAKAVGLSAGFVRGQMAKRKEMSGRSIGLIRGADLSNLPRVRRLKLDPIRHLVESYLDSNPGTSWTGLGKQIGCTYLHSATSLPDSSWNDLVSIVAPDADKNALAAVHVRGRDLQTDLAGAAGLDHVELAVEIVACGPSVGISVAREARVPQAEVDAILNGHEPPDHIARKICSIKLPREWTVPTPTGTRRRVQSLYRWGYGATEISRETGIDSHRIDDIATTSAWMHVDLGDREVIKKVFERLEMTRGGPRSGIAEWAKWRGFPLPLQWDEDDIDNPRGRVNPKTDRSNNEENVA